MTYVRATFVLVTYMSILGLSQLLLTRFSWNFKGSFLGASRTDSNSQVDICPGNICPGDICPYQEYLSCYWPDFDETLMVGSWQHVEHILQSAWHLSRQHLSWWHLSISGISQLLLTRCWPNFKGRFLDPFFNRCQSLWWYLSSQHWSW